MVASPQPCFSVFSQLKVRRIYVYHSSKCTKVFTQVLYPREQRTFKILQLSTAESGRLSLWKVSVFSLSYPEDSPIPGKPEMERDKPGKRGTEHAANPCVLTGISIMVMRQDAPEG